MDLTAEQKQRILSQVETLDNAPLVVPLLQEHLFPWLERDENSEFVSDALRVKLELKEIALDFLLQRMREQRPELSDETLLEVIPQELYRGAVYLTASALQAVTLFLDHEKALDLAVAQGTVGLDDELKRILEE